MTRTCFVCSAADAEKRFLTYHEFSRRTGGDEFFVFIDPMLKEHELPLRELFRRFVSASRLGHPAGYLRGLIEMCVDLPAAPADGAHISNATILVALRRGGEIYLLRNRRIEPVHYDAAAGSEGSLESFSARREIGISRPGRQGDLFEKHAEDQFILEAIVQAPGEHTLLMAPSREFVGRHRGVLLDSVLFPALEVPACGEVVIDTSASCPAIHWKSEKHEMTDHQERKRGGDMVKRSAPIVAGAAALVLAVILIFKPFGGGTGRPPGERDVFFSAGDAEPDPEPGHVGSETRDERSAPVEADRTVEPLTESGIRVAQALSLKEGWSRKMGGPVTSSPAICGGRVIFGSRDGRMYAFSPAGEMLWTYQASDGVGASPCCSGEKIVGADYKGNVFCVNATDGTRIWNYQAGFRIVSSPRVKGERVVVCTMDGRIIALDLESGRRIWSQTIGEAIWATPSVGADYIIAASTDGSLVRLARDGSVIWRVAPGGAIHSSPLVIENRDLVVTGTGEAYVAAYSLSDGSLRWRSAAGSEVRSAPVSDGSRIFVGTETGSLLAYDLDGGEIWRRETGGAIRSRPLILHEAILVTSYDATLSAFSIRDGSPLGRYRADSPLYSSPAYHDGKVFFGSNAGMLHAPVVTVSEG